MNFSGLQYVICQERIDAIVAYWTYYLLHKYGANAQYRCHLRIASSIRSGDNLRVEIWDRVYTRLQAPASKRLLSSTHAAATDS